MARWTIESNGPADYSGGGDARWRWELRRVHGEAAVGVLVTVTGTGMIARDVPVVVERARASLGRSAVEAVFDWELPPERIAFSSASPSPVYTGGEQYAAA